MPLFTKSDSRPRPVKSVEDIVLGNRGAPNRKEREFVEYRLNVPIHKFADKNSYLLTGTKNVWATFRACHITASTLLSTKFEIVSEEHKEGAEDHEDCEECKIHNKEIDGILANPNPYDSWEEMIYVWCFHMKLTGTAFWLKDKIVGGKPTRLWPLMPQHVKIQPDKKEKIKHFIYSVNGNEIVYKPEEIIYFRRPHPSEPIGGLGDVEPAEALYNDFINRDSLEESFVQNGAMPSGILTKKGEAITDEDEWGRIKAWWRRDHEGTKNAGKTAILNSEWNYQKLGLSSQEMQSIEKEKLSLEQIFLNHGVPLSIAGFSNAATYATARQDEFNFRRFEVVPLLDSFVAKLNHESGLLPLFNKSWKIKYLLSGLIDVEQVWKDWGGAYQNGAITPNELRELMGMQKKDDPYMDQHFLPKSKIPIEMAGLSEPAPANDFTDIEPSPILFG